MTSLLQVKGLTTRFQTERGPFTAVDNVSFSVEAGQTLALVGESGSGKSVTAMSLMRLIPQPPGRIESGEVLLDGRNLLALSEREMRSVRGNQGGYLLTCAPKDYTVGEILRIAEGDLYPVACMGDNPVRCHRYASCKTIRFWEGLYSVIDGYVNAATLEDLADETAEMDEWCYSI